jgi:type III secretion system FlhB-like substrate exporter
LGGLDIEQQIPAELYLAVAELLAFVYALNGKKTPE